MSGATSLSVAPSTTITSWTRPPSARRPCERRPRRSLRSGYQVPCRTGRPRKCDRRGIRKPEIQGSSRSRAATISSRRAGETRSSASSTRTQSCRASSSARLRDATKPSHPISSTRAPPRRATPTVPFVGRRGAPLAEVLRNRGGTEVLEAPPGPEASPGLLLAVARAARLFQPDVVYAGDSRGHGAAVWSRASSGRPLVVHRRVFFRPSGHLLSRIKYRAADRFLAVSGAVASTLAKAGVDPARIAVVPDGLPPEAFVNAPG